MLDILKWFSIKVNKNFYKILFLYNGQEIEEDYYNFTFDSYASKLDRENSSMTILVCDLDDSGQVYYDLYENNLDENDWRFKTNHVNLWRKRFLFEIRIKIYKILI